MVEVTGLPSHLCAAVSGGGGGLWWNQSRREDSSAVTVPGQKSPCDSGMLCCKERRSWDKGHHPPTIPVSLPSALAQTLPGIQHRAEHLRLP